MSLFPRKEPDEILPAIMAGPDSFWLDGELYEGKPSVVGELVEGERVMVAFTGREESNKASRRQAVILARIAQRSLMVEGPPYGIPIGQWDQQWGNVYQNAVAPCTANYTDWPGSQVYVYPTDTAGGTGQRTNPQGMAAYPDGIHFLLMHRVNTDPSATPVGFKLRVISMATWSQTLAIDVTFADDKDKSANTYFTDCQMLFDPVNRRATIFARCYWRFTAAVANSVFANVWSIEIPQVAVDAADAGLCTVLHTTITTSENTLRMQANCMNACDNHMVKGNLLYDKLWGYSHVDGVGWGDAWSVSNWKNSLKSAVATGYNYTINGGGPIVDQVDCPNYGPPVKGSGVGKSWCFPVSMVGAGADILSDSRIVEMLVNATTGVISIGATLWQQGAVLYGDANQVAELDSTLEAINYSASTPAAGWGGSEVTSHTVLMPGGGLSSRDRTTNWVWEGTLRNSTSYGPFTGPTGAPVSYQFPSSFSGDSNLETSRESHAALPAPLPLRHANTVAGWDRLYWRDQFGAAAYGESHTRGLSTPSGWRFYAALLPAGPFQLAAGFQSIIASEYTFLGAGWTPEYFADTVTVHGASVPFSQFLYETYIFSVSPAGVVAVAPLLARHTGIRVFNTAGDPATGIVTSTPMPVPENVWQWIYFAEIDRVCWLHDSRASWSSDPQPTITVTDKSLNVKYVIQPTDLLTITTFATNQYLTADPSTAWAFAGQDTRKRHGINGLGPLMKGYVNGAGECRIILGLESYDFVEPVAGEVGTTYSRTSFIHLEANGFSVDQVTTTTSSWTYPNVTTGGQNGSSIIRNLAIMGDRILFRRASNSLREVM